MPALNFLEVLSTLAVDYVLSEYFINKWLCHSIMKPIGEVEEELANKALPILGFKPSSKIKRGPIGILISIICIAIVYRELNSAGII